MTIQEFYNKVLKEEMSKNDFLYFLRKNDISRQYITNTTSYDDAVHILKSKQFLSEEVKPESAIKKFDFVGTMNSFKNFDKEQKKKTIDQVNYYEFERGWRVEYALCKDVEKAKAKALKNIQNDDIYYTRLLTGAKKPAKRTDLPMEVDPKKKDSLKDPNNQMKSPKGIEKYKADGTKKIDTKASKKPVGVKSIKEADEKKSQNLYSDSKFYIVKFKDSNDEVLVYLTPKQRNLFNDKQFPISSMKEIEVKTDEEGNVTLPDDALNIPYLHVGGDEKINMTIKTSEGTQKQSVNIKDLLEIVKDYDIEQISVEPGQEKTKSAKDTVFTKVKSADKDNSSKNVDFATGTKYGLSGGKSASQSMASVSKQLYYIKLKSGFDFTAEIGDKSAAKIKSNIKIGKGPVEAISKPKDPSVTATKLKPFEASIEYANSEKKDNFPNVTMDRLAKMVTSDAIDNIKVDSSAKAGEKKLTKVVTTDKSSPEKKASSKADKGAEKVLKGNRFDTTNPEKIFTKGEKFKTVRFNYKKDGKTEFKPETFVSPDEKELSNGDKVFPLYTYLERGPEFDGLLRSTQDGKKHYYVTPNGETYPLEGEPTFSDKDKPYSKLKGSTKSDVSNKPASVGSDENNVLSIRDRIVYTLENSKENPIQSRFTRYELKLEQENSEKLNYPIVNKHIYYISGDNQIIVEADIKSEDDAKVSVYLVEKNGNKKPLFFVSSNLYLSINVSIKKILSPVMGPKVDINNYKSNVKKADELDSENKTIKKEEKDNSPISDKIGSRVNFVVKGDKPDEKINVFGILSNGSKNKKGEFHIYFANGTKLVIAPDKKSGYYVDKDGNEKELLSVTDPSLSSAINQVYPDADKTEKLKEAIKNIVKKKLNEEIDGDMTAGPDVLAKKLDDLMKRYEWYFDDNKDDYVKRMGQTKHDVAMNLVNRLGKVGVKIFNHYAPKDKQIIYGQKDNLPSPNNRSTVSSDMSQYEEGKKPSGDLNKPSYNFYVVDGKDKKIITGWQDKSSATDFKKQFNNRGFIVLSKDEVMSKARDPRNNSNWKHIPGVNDYEFKGISEENDTTGVQEYIKAMQDMDPKEIAKNVLAGKYSIQSVKSVAAARILGTAVANGEKDKDVIKAFHTLSDNLNK